MLNVYADLCINDAAVPVIRGKKSDREKFAGAMHTYTVEAMMGDKKALQSGTSHNLGQNFAKAFDIKYLDEANVLQHVDEANVLQHVWTTSWGMSTRMVGCVVMAHGDDKGLRLPPKIAPYQVVIVPIYKSDEEKSAVLGTVERISGQLAEAGIRFHVDRREGQSPGFNHVDRREGQSPGFKYNDWEMRGVPVRMEIGPKDVEKNSAALARRDVPGKEGKQFVPQDGIVQAVKDLLNAVQANMLQQATAFRDANIHDVKNYDELKQVIEAGGWARGWWAGSGADEGKIKEETAATIRCFPFDQPGGNGPVRSTWRQRPLPLHWGKSRARRPVRPRILIEVPEG